MATGQELVDAVVEQGGFDTASTGLSRATVTSWVAARYQDMVVRAKWRKAIVSIGTTVAGQAEYPLADVVLDVDELRVDGGRFSAIGVEEMWDLDSGRVMLAPGYSGVFAPSFGATGTESIRLNPVPTVSGQAIEALAILPPEAFEDDAGYIPSIPADLHDRLIDAAIATGLKRIDERLGEAQVYEQRFEEGVGLLAARRVARQSQPVSTLRVSRRPR